MNTFLLVISILSGVLSVGVAVYYFRWVKSQDPGSERAQQVATWIREGAQSYLKKLYGALGMLAVSLAIILAIVFGVKEASAGYGLGMAGSFVLGALSSAIAGYMGMAIAVEANVRSATAANKGLNPAFNVAFKAGTVMGLAMVGLALIGMSLVFLLSGEPQMVLGFSFGASTWALLAKAGGGIFTKTADIAADLVGKVEVGIPEDDPRNPAVVADNVGDNVGDVAGMGADIFDSYVASSVAAMLLGAALTKLDPDTRIMYTIFPLLLCMLGSFASIIGVQFVRVKEGGKPGTALNLGTVYTCVIFGVFVTVLVLGVGLDITVLWATLAGLITGVVIGFSSDFFTGDDRPPVVETAKVSGSGSAITIITGFSYGLISVVPSVIGIVIAMMISYYVSETSSVINGVYGVGISAVGMLAISGMIVSSDAYGPIVDNARGIAEMAGMPENVIDIADKLDAAGNTAKAITKGFAISAAALTVLALFAAYASEMQLEGISIVMSLRNPVVLAGIFLGAATPPFFSALLMLSVTKNAFLMIEEIRRQFREEPGILAGTVVPDYVTCVTLASHNALSSLVLPALLAVVLPLVVGFVMGPEALGGFLGGAIFTGIIFALLMANAGGLWDNAKKYIESGHFGGKGSEAHKAGVVGDTVGDPFKDTAGPSLNTLITVMALVSSLFTPVIAAFHLFQ
ncbi:MAG: sodium-translocating pyrophosphatase [Anaerolineales bacterium]|nr:MAG: sodium-translocating pyrophosphatase [Anaerolineales bacterium]